jgi:hypothetical protein
MTPVGDIAEALAYQIKKEIAENYFGTRKVLEEEREDLMVQISQLLKIWEKEVLSFLEGILYYLVDKESGKAFLRLIRQEAWRESSGALKESSPSKSIAALCLPAFALTTRGKYINLILSLYRKAEDQAGPLIQAFKALLTRVKMYNEELSEFQGRFNLLDILSFVKAMNNLDNLKGVLGDNSDPRAIPALEKTMVLKPIKLEEEVAFLIGPMPPLIEVQKPLRRLVGQAFQNHSAEIKKRLQE